MTVTDLIERLKTMPGDADVVYHGTDGMRDWYATPDEIRFDDFALITKHHDGGFVGSYAELPTGRLPDSVAFLTRKAVLLS